MESTVEIVDNLWAATAKPAHAFPVLSGERTAEICVIGGGFTGLSAALHLSEGGSQVVVLESQTIGFGASGRNGGQVNPGLKPSEAELVRKFGEKGRAFYGMGQEAPDFLADLIARLNLQCGYVRSGLVRLAHNRRALQSLRRAGDSLRKQGVAVEDLDAAEVAARVGTNRYPGGLVDPRGRQVQPLDLAREMAIAARSAGAEIFTSSPALSLKSEAGKWRVKTAIGSVIAKTVVVATNGYSDALIPGLASSLLPVNSFQVATAPLPSPLFESLIRGGETVYDSRRLVLYFRKSADRRIVLGSRATFSRANSQGETVADYSAPIKVLHGIFPELKPFPIEKKWTGLVCVTMDHLPHYHRPAENLHVLLGYNGRGVAMANRSGAWLAHSLLALPDSGFIPVTPIRKIPFHNLRAPMLDVAIRWNRLLDFFGW